MQQYGYEMCATVIVSEIARGTPVTWHTTREITCRPQRDFPGTHCDLGSLFIK
jgi:hypothetical protein